jgi:hypothetical protein
MAWSKTLFFVPHEVPRADVLESISNALFNFDLEKPRRVMFSPEAMSARDGVHTFALGDNKPQSRRIHRGFFLDMLSHDFVVGFISREPEGDEEVFEVRGADPASSWLLCSRGPLLAGSVTDISVPLPQAGLSNAELVSAKPGSKAYLARTSAWGAIRIGAAQTGYRVALTGWNPTSILVWGPGGTLKNLGRTFADLMFAGLEPGDPYPRDTDTTKIGVSQPTSPPRPEQTPQLPTIDCMALENEVRAIMSDGGDLEEALRILDRVLAIHPAATHSLALRGMVLERLGRPELTDALRQRFLKGVESPGKGDVMFLTVIYPAQALVEHLIERGELDQARAVLQRATAALTPAYVHHLDPLRHRLS